MNEQTAGSLLFCTRVTWNVSLRNLWHFITFIIDSHSTFTSATVFLSASPPSLCLTSRCGLTRSIFKRWYHTLSVMFATNISSVKCGGLLDHQGGEIWTLCLGSPFNDCQEIFVSADGYLPSDRYKTWCVHAVVYGCGCISVGGGASRLFCAKTALLIPLSFRI